MSWEQDTPLPGAWHQAWLQLRWSPAKKGLLIVAVLCLLILPAMLIIRGLDLESIAGYGYTGVFLATFLSTACIFFPAPGFVVVVVAAALFNPIWVALAATAGGALGEFTSYLVGYWGRAVIDLERRQRYKRAENWMMRYGGVAVFLFALVPGLIFDLIAIAAGAVRFPFWKFLLASFAGRLPRSFLEAYLGWMILPRFLPL
ncbi:MAG: VTT domain-containing protein [Dehalococcoidia bacterium]|nr:VTT domain-containing protein [Dehalococcoidia bacterium]